MISFQLYSVREEIKNESLAAVLRAVKAAGFDAVETAGFYGLTFAAFKNAVDGAGLAVSGTHTGLGEFADGGARVAEMVKTLGVDTVIVPNAALNTAYGATVEALGAAYGFAVKNGIKLGYHNHGHEFEGRDWLMRLASDIPGLFFELDVCWLVNAGHDAVEYVTRHSDRIKILHVKELAAVGRPHPAPLLGEGVTDMANVLRAAKKAGIEAYVLEVEGFPCDWRDYLAHARQFIAENGK
jgi:sugar phosphate isomerase/epimerase